MLLDVSTRNTRSTPPHANAERKTNIFKSGYRTTRTEKALKFLKTHMFKKWYGGRKNATHVAILISDGRSQDRKATRKEARKAKEAGIKIFTIGVGKRADLEELKEIASDPDEF
jgi:uncharacterized protein YegL